MIVLDVETTGVDPQRHSIVSIGALDFLEPKNNFYQECKIWDGTLVAEEALKINGFSLKEILDPNKQTLESTLKNFIYWAKDIDDKTIAGQNPAFDRDFLITSLQRCGIKYIVGHRTIDLHSLCYSHYLKRGLNPPIKDGRTNLNLDKILNYVGLPEEPKPHNALTGAKSEAEALSRLIYGRSLLAEFEKYQIPNYLLYELMKRFIS